MTAERTPVELVSWIAANRADFTQPVGNKEIWREPGDQFIVMVSVGPNARNDFHYCESDEVFIQGKGPVCIDWYDESGERRRTDVAEGEVYTMPARVPHCPNRPADSWGIIVQRRRAPGEDDGIRWYCPECGETVHEAWFALHDIGRQVKEAIETFNADEQLRTCGACSAVHPVAEEFVTTTGTK